MLTFFVLFQQNRQPMITQMSSVSNVNLPLRPSAPNQVGVALLSQAHMHAEGFTQVKFNAAFCEVTAVNCAKTKCQHRHQRSHTLFLDLRIPA